MSVPGWSFEESVTGGDRFQLGIVWDDVAQALVAQVEFYWRHRSPSRFAFTLLWFECLGIFIAPFQMGRLALGVIQKKFGQSPDY